MMSRCLIKLRRLIVATNQTATRLQALASYMVVVGDTQLAEVHIEVAQPVQLEASDAATLNTSQFLSIFHFKSRETELAYSRFHLDLWRNRVRFLAVGCQLMGLFYTLNARVNLNSQKGFRRAVEADFPDEAKYNLAFTMFVRYVEYIPRSRSP